MTHLTTAQTEKEVEMSQVEKIAEAEIVAESAVIISPNAGGAITPMRMIEMALSNGSGVETIEKLMALHERWEANNGRKAFDQAMALARAKIPTIVKAQEVDFTSNKGRTHYKYEDLASIAMVVDPVLSEFGLSYRFRASQDGATLTVTCIIAHRDGYSEETSLSAQNDTSGGKNGIQSVGSAATYLQRYTLKLSLGLSAAKDDDAQSCSQPQNDTQRPMQTVTPDQFVKLRNKAVEAGVDEETLCKAGGAVSLHEFPADKFKSAMKKLQVTIEKNQPEKSADIDDEIPY